MTSIRMRLQNLMLRRIVRPWLARERDPHKIRDHALKFDHRQGAWPPRGCHVTPVEQVHWSADWIVPESGHDDRVILYLHGGAFIAKTPRIHGAMLGKWVCRTGARAFMVDYRLAPDYPLPAANQDCEDAYRFLLEEGYDPAKMVIAGDSAGGALTLTTLLRIKKAGLPMPAGAVLLSPATGLHESERTSAVTNDGRDPMFRAATLQNFWNMLGIEGAVGDDFHPIDADLEGLPPLHMEVGSSEVLLDDSRIFAERAKAAGVSVKLIITENAPHVFPVMKFPEARRAIERMTAFVNRVMSA